MYDLSLCEAHSWMYGTFLIKLLEKKRTNEQKKERKKEVNE